VNVGGHPTFVALQNNDRLLAFAATATAPSRVVALRCLGSAGNPSAIGSSVRLFDGARLVSAHEVSAGSGYQSQSTATVFLTVPRNIKKPRLAIRWPDGQETEAALPRDDVVELKAPR
jgi:enediyne biosynthesis protein E4